MKLGLQLLPTFSSQLDDGSFFPARVGATTLAPYPQAGSKVDLGEFLGLEVVQEQLERFNPRRCIADRVGQEILVALDLEFGDSGNRAIRTHVAHEPVDFARCQLPLTALEIAEVPGRRLAKVHRVDFWYGITSRGEPVAAQRVAKLYGWTCMGSGTLHECVGRRRCSTGY